MKGKIYCSENVDGKLKVILPLKKLMNNMKFLVIGKVAQHFGLTRKIIQGIRKRNS